LIPLLLLLLPLLEIATFVIVGGAIGVLPTIGLVIASAVLGMVLLRISGVGALARAQTEVQSGRDPGQHLARAGMIAVAAVLLLIPGFLTDIIALLLLIPAVRALIWRMLKSRMAVSGRFASFGNGASAQWSANTRDSGRGPVIDLDEEDYSRQANPKSPWRIEKND